MALPPPVVRTASRTYGPRDPSLARAVFVAVLAAGAVLAVVAAVALVVGHDPDRLVPTKHGSERGGYLILFPELFACAAYFALSGLALVAYVRTRSRDVAAAFAVANVIFAPFVAAWAAGPWLAGADMPGASPAAAGRPLLDRAPHFASPAHRLVHHPRRIRQWV